MDEGRRARLRDLLTAGPVWGAEVDLRYRVLALTIEPAAGRHPLPHAPDRRLQVLVHPVGAIAAALVSHEPGSHRPGSHRPGSHRPAPRPGSTATGNGVSGSHQPGSTATGDGVSGDVESRTVLRFEPEHLPDVVAALDGPVPLGDPLPARLPDLDAMQERLSLRGMAQVAEGHRTPLALTLVHEDLSLDLWATFDEVEVRDTAGAVVDW